MVKPYYDNTLMQYITNFNGCKDENFQLFFNHVKIRK